MSDGIDGIDGGDGGDGTDGIVAELLAESHEALERFDRDVRALEERPHDRDVLRSASRVLHTVKGTCGSLGFPTLEAVAHAGEDVVGRLRDRDLAMAPEVVRALVATGQALRGILATIEATGTDRAGDHTALIEHLRCLRAPAADVLVVADPGGSRGAAPSATIADAPAGPEPVASRPDGVGAGDGDGAIPVDAGTLDPLLRSRVPRLARHLARTCGKRVRVEVEGAATRLDPTIVEAIRDPLTHLVRNAVDHGIERPDARVAAGKVPEGVLRLRARREGGHVHLEVSDDGAGIDAAALRRAAVAKGVVPAAVAERMGEREALGLVFAPGVSTAEAVTTVSGRGVGMDVVKAGVERVGGTVAVRTAAGRGTTFEVRIPLRRPSPPPR